jgi:hypothetical protein
MLPRQKKLAAKGIARPSEKPATNVSVQQDMEDSGSNQKSSKERGESRGNHEWE